MPSRKRRGRQTSDASSGTHCASGGGMGALLGCSAGDGSAETPASSSHDDPRLAGLVDMIVSPAVQLQAPAELEEVKAELSPAEVESAFVDRLGSGVLQLRYRDGPSAALDFLKAAYADGIPNYRKTAMHNHYLWLLRLVVHRGREGGADSVRHLRNVAEAFQDCQDVQARVIEREGLELRGISLDFRSHVVKLAGDYKLVALQMLAAEKIRSGNTIHYENLILRDLGDRLGMNRPEVKRAELDREVSNRFQPLSQREALAFEARFKRLFDVGAMLKAFCNEANSFSPSSAPDSLPRRFLDWGSAHLKDPHRVFDETQTHICIDEVLAVPCLEAVLLGQAQRAEDRGLFVT